MIRLVFAIFLLASCGSLMAQAGDLSQRVLNRLSRNGANGPQDVVGSPYLIEDYRPSEVYTANGKFVVAKMRYNVFEDAFECDQGESIYAIYPVDAVKRIILDGRIFIIDEYEFKGKLRKGFFILQDTGMVKLYLKKNVEFKDRELPTPTKYLGEPPRFIKGADSFYFKIGDSLPVKFSSFENIISKLPERKETLTQYVKQNKLVNRKAVDIVNFVRFCNNVK